MCSRWKEIASLGDVNPVDHGGGKVFKCGRRYVLVYNTFGLEEWVGAADYVRVSYRDMSLEEQEEAAAETEIPVLFLELPTTFDEFRAAYGDMPWAETLSYTGWQEGFETALREARFTKNIDQRVTIFAYMIESLRQYGAIDDGDSMSARDLEKLYDTGRFKF